MLNEENGYRPARRPCEILDVERLAKERIEEMPSTLHIPPAWFIATAMAAVFVIVYPLILCLFRLES